MNNFALYFIQHIGRETVKYDGDRRSFLAAFIRAVPTVTFDCGVGLPLVLLLFRV